MMSEQQKRYPGVQPFSDDAFSQRLFFGREEESLRLVDKIVANRTVVVYGHSGLGKTSLLNAGAAPLLREDGYIPLFVRVNDTTKSILRSVMDAIPAQAAGRGVEYISGQTDSLWRFFKTAEFWCEDLLLTPVIIFDQFEELFTLQHEEAREALLDELSFLIRGECPPSAIDHDLSERSPDVRVVFSLSEDYLGFLEETAERIPQIYDSRFRLTPLSPDAATMATLGPAHIDDALFSTRPFNLEEQAVSTILDFLSQRRSTSAAYSRPYIEPFQLQLVCHHVEHLAAAKQQQSTSKITVTLQDIGWEAGLERTLKDFYSESIRHLESRRVRKASHRLCEDYLISADGRRLSLEENEIKRQLGLSKAELGELVSSRLLHTENRSESTYYELSHDALVEPILAAQQQKAQLTGWLGIVAGSMLLLMFSMLMLLTIGRLFYNEYISADIDPVEFNLEIVVFGLFFIFLVVGAVSSFYFLRNSARSLLRHQLAREATAAGLPHSLWLQSGIMIVSGIGIVIFGLMLLYAAVLFVSIPFSETLRQLAAASNLAGEVEQILKYGIGLDSVAFVIASVAVLFVGARLVRQGIFKMIGFSGRAEHKTPEKTPGETRFGSIKSFFWVLEKLLGVLFLAGGLLYGIAILVEVECYYLEPGGLFGEAFAGWFSLVQYYCQADNSTPVMSIAGNLFIMSACIFAAVPLLRSSEIKNRNCDQA